MIKILVTGSNGLLGQKITDLILSSYSSQIKLIATSRGSNRHPLKKGYTYHSLDISNKTDVEIIIEKHKPHFVINTAAATNVDWCTDHQNECWEANVMAVQNLINACKKNETHLIHLSTDFIFDGRKGSLYNESDNPAPVSYYGESKLAAEKIIQNSTINWAILRTVLVYGVVADMSRSNVVLWVKKNLENNNKINVVSDQFRTPTLAEDLAQGCILACLNNANGIFNISGPNYMSIYELAIKVANEYKLDHTLISKVDSSYLNQTAKRPHKTGFDLSKAKTQLNYIPHSFEEGLKIIKKQLPVG